MLIILVFKYCNNFANRQNGLRPIDVLKHSVICPVTTKCPNAPNPSKCGVIFGFFVSIFAHTLRKRCISSGEKGDFYL